MIPTKAAAAATNGAAGPVAGASAKMEATVPPSVDPIAVA